MSFTQFGTTHHNKKEKVEEQRQKEFLEINNKRKNKVFCRYLPFTDDRVPPPPLPPPPFVPTPPAFSSFSFFLFENCRLLCAVLFFCQQIPFAPVVHGGVGRPLWKGNIFPRF